MSGHERIDLQKNKDECNDQNVNATACFFRKSWSWVLSAHHDARKWGDGEEGWEEDGAMDRARAGGGGWEWAEERKKK